MPDSALIRLDSSTLTSTASSITFSNIDQSYSHLFLIGSARSDRAANADTFSMRFNSDTAGNYFFQQALISAAGTSSSQGDTGDTDLRGPQLPAANAATFFFPIDLIFASYARTDRLKTVLSGSTNYNDDGVVRQSFWNSLVAINTLACFPRLGSNFTTGTSIALWALR